MHQAQVHPCFSQLWHLLQGLWVSISTASYLGFSAGQPPPSHQLLLAGLFSLHGLLSSINSLFYFQLMNCQATAPILVSVSISLIIFSIFLAWILSAIQNSVTRESRCPLAILKIYLNFKKEVQSCLLQKGSISSLLSIGTKVTRLPQFTKEQYFFRLLFITTSIHSTACSTSHFFLSKDIELSFDTCCSLTHVLLLKGLGIPTGKEPHLHSACYGSLVVCFPGMHVGNSIVSLKCERR